MISKLFNKDEVNYKILIAIVVIMIMSKHQGNSQAFSEWTIPKGIALVYPERLPENPQEKIKKKDLIDFYISFIHTILENADIDELTIIHRQGLKEKLLEEFKNFGKTDLNLIEIGYVQDIWIRDFTPFCFYENKAFKALYNPRYFQEKNRKTNYADKEKTIFYYASLDDQAGRELAAKLNVKIVDINYGSQPLVLDGGNFIHNGQGTGITTNRIIADNESLSINQIREIFEKQLDISKLIIVPVEPGDETGHIDGMVRFTSENTVVVAEYSVDYPEGKKFMDNIKIHLQEELPSYFKIIRITNETPEEPKQNKFPSAYGNYINYLRIGNTIFLPQYGNNLTENGRLTMKMDKAAKEKYEKEGFNVIPVGKDIVKLAELGGVLNCITWTYY